MSNQDSPTAEERIKSLLAAWRSRTGSAIGQYRLGHKEVGVLFVAIESLTRELAQAKERIAELHRQTMVLRMREEARQEAPAQLSIEAVPVSVLREHWITGVECDHENETDIATCYCSKWRSTPQPNVPSAVDEWIRHLTEQSSAQPSIESQTRAECEHEWSAIRRLHTCLKGCGAVMSVSTGEIKEFLPPPTA